MDSFPASDPPQWDSLAAGRPVMRPLRQRSEIEATARATRAAIAILTARRRPRLPLR